MQHFQSLHSGWAHGCMIFHAQHRLTKQCWLAVDSLYIAAFNAYLSCYWPNFETRTSTEKMKAVASELESCCVQLGHLTQMQCLPLKGLASFGTCTGSWMLTAGRLMPSPTQPTSGGAALCVSVIHTCLVSIHFYVSRSLTLCSLAQKNFQLLCHVSCNMYVIAQPARYCRPACRITAEAALNTAACISQLAIQQVLRRHVLLSVAL